LVSRTKLPLEWAMTQNYLGLVLQTLGEREAGAACLEQAVTPSATPSANSLASAVPHRFATTQNNLRSR